MRLVEQLAVPLDDRFEVEVGTSGESTAENEDRLSDAEQELLGDCWERVVPNGHDAGPACSG